MAEKATYTHGHHTSVVSSHARRTVNDSAAFLLPHIQPHHQILDLGCGPGSISVGLAKLVPQGSVIGGDAVASVLDQARDLAASESISNISFQHTDGNALPFSDASFDIAFCHQVLQHVADPVGILKEMRRVTKPGGIVAARDADYLSFIWYPVNPDIDLWMDVYRKLAKKNGAEPDAGRHLKAWAVDAGFTTNDLEMSWSMYNYQNDQAVAFGQSWKDRTLHSGFATGALENGLAGQDVLERISKAWTEWSASDGAFIVIPNGEIICRV